MAKTDPTFALAALLHPRWTVFLHVAQTGSLTRAAAEAGSSQPVISRQLAALETECGARLFERTGRGMKLTEFGKRLVPRVQAMVNEAARLGDEVQTARGVPMGEVHVGLLPFSVSLFAEKLVREIRVRFPLVRLHMTEGTSVQLAEGVLTGRLDMALLLREGAGDDRSETTVTRMPLHLIGAADDPLLRAPTVSFSKLQGLPLVLPPQPHAMRSHLDEVAAAKGVRLSVAVEANSIALQKEIAAAGGVYAIVSGGAVAPDVTARRLASSRIVAPTLWRRVVLCSTRHRPEVLATRAVRALVQELSARYLVPSGASPVSHPTKEPR